jgi:hypothetical protein
MLARFTAGTPSEGLVAERVAGHAARSAGADDRLAGFDGVFAVRGLRIGSDGRIGGGEVGGQV